MALFLLNLDSREADFLNFRLVLLVPDHLFVRLTVFAADTADLVELSNFYFKRSWHGCFLLLLAPLRDVRTGNYLDMHDFIFVAIGAEIPALFVAHLNCK